MLRGLLHPILVSSTWTNRHFTWHLLHGQRRWLIGIYFVAVHEFPILHHLQSFLLQLIYIILVLVICGDNQVLETQIGRLWVKLLTAEGTDFFDLCVLINASFAESVPTWEENKRVVIWREEEFEADWASVRHDLIVESLFGCQLTRVMQLALLLGWCNLQIPLFQFVGHSCEHLLDYLRLVSDLVRWSDLLSRALWPVWLCTRSCSLLCARL